MTGPIKIEVELDLDACIASYRHWSDTRGEMVGASSIEEIVLAQAAHELAQKAMRGASGDERTSLAARISRITQEEVRARVVPLIEEALSQPFHQTNQYGESTGPETTLRAEIGRLARDYLTKPADSFSRGNALQQFIAGEVKRAVDAELKSALDAAKAEVATAVKNQAAEMMTKTITGMAGIR